MRSLVTRSRHFGTPLKEMQPTFLVTSVQYSVNLQQILPTCDAQQDPFFLLSIFDMQNAANRGINFVARSLDPKGPKPSANAVETLISAPNALSVPHILTGVLAYNSRAVFCHNKRKVYHTLVLSLHCDQKYDNNRGCCDE